MKVKGLFTIEHIRDGKVIGRYKAPNGVTNAGLDHILSTQFLGGTQVSNWYIGLIDSSGFTGLAAADTMSSHAGWSESTDYDEAARQGITLSANGTGVVINLTYPAFTITSGSTLKGFFVTSSSTKGGTSGTLWSTALFDNGEKEFSASDIVRVQYSVTIGT